MATTDHHPTATEHDQAIDERLVADAEVPLSRRAQRQGDVLVLPLTDKSAGNLAPPEVTVPIPAEGVPVVQGEATDNVHLLVGDGTWSPATTAPDLGVVQVATSAYLLHPEHAALGIGAGSYLLRRQREFSSTGQRVVAD